MRRSSACSGGLLVTRNRRDRKHLANPDRKSFRDPQVTKTIRDALRETAKTVEERGNIFAADGSRFNTPNRPEPDEAVSEDSAPPELRYPTIKAHVSSSERAPRSASASRSRRARPLTTAPVLESRRTDSGTVSHQSDRSGQGIFLNRNPTLLRSTVTSMRPFRRKSTQERRTIRSSQPTRAHGRWTKKEEPLVCARSPRRFTRSSNEE